MHYNFDLVNQLFQHIHTQHTEHSEKCTKIQFYSGRDSLLACLHCQKDHCEYASWVADCTK